jgi:hypothetical protein
MGLGEVPEDKGEGKGEADGTKIPTYQDLVTEEPLRNTDIDGVKTPKSLGEEEEDTVSRSDLKEAMHKLLPRFRDKRIDDLLQSAMVSRIFPDNYIDKHFLITASLIEEQEPDDDIDVLGIISMVQDGLSIGYEGRGRIDILEIAGVAHEEEMEKLSKELGL